MYSSYHPAIKLYVLGETVERVFLGALLRIKGFFGLCKYGAYWSLYLTKNIDLSIAFCKVSTPSFSHIYSVIVGMGVLNIMTNTVLMMDSHSCRYDEFERKCLKIHRIIKRFPIGRVLLNPYFALKSSNN